MYIRILFQTLWIVPMTLAIWLGFYEITGSFCLIFEEALVLTAGTSSRFRRMMICFKIVSNIILFILIARAYENMSFLYNILKYYQIYAILLVINAISLIYLLITV